MSKFKGDSGKLRQALLMAGFMLESENHIWSDTNVNGRRLKLTRVSGMLRDVVEMPRLDNYLRLLFGDRLVASYFINKAPTYMPASAAVPYYCVYLKKE